jgi:beta-galactosidase
MEFGKTNRLSTHAKPGVFLAMLLLGAWWATAAEPLAVPFDSQWRFVRADLPQAQTPQFDDQTWETVTLPHTAHVEALVTGPGTRQWQGICWYRKTFESPPKTCDKEIFLRFDGAMNTADIWVNGQSAGRFMGGYLPYVMDISKLARPGEKNVIAVRLDNRDNPVTGPKPLADLDFNLYGSLYRDAHLVVKNKLRITAPSARSPVYSGPVWNAPQLRAAILVNEEVVARADSRTSAPATSDRAVAIPKANAQRE